MREQRYVIDEQHPRTAEASGILPDLDEVYFTTGQNKFWNIADALFRRSMTRSTVPTVSHHAPRPILLIETVVIILKINAHERDRDM
jgi:hypothetical protein